MIHYANHPFLIVSLEGEHSLTPQDRKRLSHPAVAGVILFDEQDGTVAQIKSLTQSIKMINHELVIMIDQEGGSVKRFHQHAPPLDSHQSLALTGQVYEQAQQTANYLQECGVDLNLGPVLDLHSEHSPIIGARGRSFSSQTDEIIYHAKTWIKAHHDQNIFCVGKHFPGHGFANKDSHLDQVIDQRSLEDLENLDLKPYQALINQLDTLMLAHITYPKINQTIVPHSSFWIHYIRDKLQYKGIVIADCLTMKGIKGSMLSKVDKALKAGCDWMFICHDFLAVNDVLNQSWSIENTLAKSRLSSVNLTQQEVESLALD